jgi:hypothetical protein
VATIVRFGIGDTSSEIHDFFALNTVLGTTPLHGFSPCVIGIQAIRHENGLAVAAHRLSD